VKGKEANQGVAYLDDGTMVVVDGARRMINKSVDVIVTSVHQTTAGKMIFGRLEERADQALPRYGKPRQRGGDKAMAARVPMRPSGRKHPRVFRSRARRSGRLYRFFLSRCRIIDAFPGSFLACSMKSAVEAKSGAGDGELRLPIHDIPSLRYTLKFCDPRVEASGRTSLRT